MKQRYKKSEDVQALLLDTAEALFAERGYWGVSIRDITDRAKLRNASVNYHFGSKDQLFQSVIARRFQPLSEARLEQLSAVEVTPDQPENTVREIADAFAGPMFKFAADGGPGWKNYCILIAHLAVQKFWGENAVSAQYDANAQLFINALQKTFPQCSAYRIHCCFQFLLSATLYCVCDNKRIDTLSARQFRSDDLAMLKSPMLDFMTSGIMGVAAVSSS